MQQPILSKVSPEKLGPSQLELTNLYLKLHITGITVPQYASPAFADIDKVAESRWVCMSGCNDRILSSHSRLHESYRTYRCTIVSAII